jgi:steroid 5-alpha reductase family enzyme
MNFSTLLTCLKDLFVRQLPKVAVTEFVMWGLSTYINNPTLVDVTWCLNHWIVGTSIATQNFTDLSLVLSGRKNLLHWGLLSMWLVRLGGFLFYTRIMKPYVDPRYKSMAAKRNMNESLYYFMQFQFQGVLSMITAIPLYFLFNQKSQELQWNNYLGVGLAVAGLVGEAVADNQLYAFKQKRKEKSETLREGLFKKARHPNLFFECVFWSGLAVSAIDTNDVAGTWWAGLGPLALWAIMNYVTIPITTSHMKKSKANYEETIKSTNKFWPF